MNLDPVNILALEQAAAIGKLACYQLQTKYAKGQKEHGGNFFKKPTVDNVREEVLDLIAYSHVLIQHRDELANEIVRLKERLQAGLIDPTALLAELDLLATLAKGL